MGFRVRLDGCGKSRHAPGSDPRVVQCIASLIPITTNRRTFTQDINLDIIIII